MTKIGMKSVIIMTLPRISGRQPPVENRLYTLRKNDVNILFCIYRSLFASDTVILL